MKKNPLVLGGIKLDAKMLLVVLDGFPLLIKKKCIVWVGVFPQFDVFQAESLELLGFWQFGNDIVEPCRTTV